MANWFDNMTRLLADNTLSRRKALQTMAGY